MTPPVSAAVRLRVWKTEHAAAAELPLPALSPGTAETVELRCLRGASGVHIVLSDGEGVRLRAEIGAEPGEVVPLQVEVDEQGAPQISSRDRSVLFLPVDARYDPPAPIQPAQPDAPLDLAIIVDGTMQSWGEKAPVNVAEQQAASAPPGIRLLDRQELWAAHVEKLVDFAVRAGDGRETRLAVIAFGDQELPAVTARDLRPGYRLHPPEEERVLRPLHPERLQKQLLTVPATPGGDFVDALADALAACLQLRWRKQARKLIVLTGDSPGASLLHAFPKGADLCVRQHDVDTQALALHCAGVEILTIHHSPPSDLGLHQIPFQRDLLWATRSQYARLASIPELAFDADTFEPHQAADLVRQIEDPIGRRASLGVLAGVREMAGPTPGNAPTPDRSAAGR